MAPKIIQIGSNEYDKGRIDFFVVEKKFDFHDELISFLSDIGFTGDCLNDLDSDYTNQIGHNFVFKNEMRFHLFLNEHSVNFILDTNIPKEEIMDKLEKYFQIF